MAAPETTPASPILTESFQEDPYPVIHSLRKDDPVHWVPLGFWFAQQGSIYIFVLLIFFYAWRMNKIDQKFDVHED